MTILAVAGLILLLFAAICAVVWGVLISMIRQADRTNPYRMHDPDKEECQCWGCYTARRDRRL